MRLAYQYNEFVNTKKEVLIFLCLFFAVFFHSNAQEYRVSLLTADPGDELYSAFGHSAIRVLDQNSGEDYIFNYGTFDFNTSFFYIKFMRRTLDYMLSVGTYPQFMNQYQWEQRAVREQVLDLNPEQTLKMVRFLQENYRPENRYYRYDFFYDNCATRIRDMMEEVLGNNLKWIDPAEEREQTFRELIDEYVYRMPWADLGIDLALGSVIDQKASEWEKQFLPDYMEAAFGRAMIEGDGPTRPLVKSQSVLLDLPEKTYEGSLFNPYLLMWVLAFVFIGITYWGYRQQRLFVGFDVGLFGILGMLGLLITVLWFLTYHSQTKYNWNILWAFPLHLSLCYGLLQTSPKEWVRKYLFFALILADIAVLIWIFGWQSFHPSIIPLLLVIILRTNYLYYNLNRLKATKNKVPIG